MSRTFKFLRIALLGLVLAGSLRATVVRPPDFSGLVRKAEQVVRGEVVAVRGETRASGGASRVVTIVTLKVEETLVGAPVSMLELEFLGGAVGARRLTVVGQPQFRVGDREILFVQKNGGQISPLVGMMYGRYPVVKDPAGGSEPLVARENGVPLANVAAVGSPLGEHSRATPALTASTTLTVADFQQRIREEAIKQGRIKPAAQP